MDKELLFSVTKKDLEIQTFRAGGKGGQKQNKTSSGARVIHRESGAVGESREQRSQSQNIKTAFIRMSKTKEFLSWLKVKVAKVSGKMDDIIEIVNKEMSVENLKVEVHDDNGNWIEYSDQGGFT